MGVPFWVFIWVFNLKMAFTKFRERHEAFKLAERVGFEPTAPCGVTGFQDQLLKPLGHLSIAD